MPIRRATNKNKQVAVGSGQSGEEMPKGNSNAKPTVFSFLKEANMRKRNSYGYPQGIEVRTYKQSSMRKDARWYVIPAIILTILLGVVALACAQVTAPAYTNEQIADAIYRAEGGEKTRHPYGILSVKVSGKEEARRVCLNTIRKQRKRHADHACGFSFLECLQRRYAPIGAFNDPRNLNSNWLKNVKYFLEKMQ